MLFLSYTATLHTVLYTQLQGTHQLFFHSSCSTVDVSLFIDFLILLSSTLHSIILQFRAPNSSISILCSSTLLSFIFLISTPCYYIPAFFVWCWILRNFNSELYILILSTLHFKHHHYLSCLSSTLYLSSGHFSTFWMTKAALLSLRFFDSWFHNSSFSRSSLFIISSLPTSALFKSHYLSNSQITNSPFSMSSLSNWHSQTIFFPYLHFPLSKFPSPHILTRFTSFHIYYTILHVSTSFSFIYPLSNSSLFNFYSQTLSFP